MNLKKLEQLCAEARSKGLQDNAPVLLPSSDHSHRHAHGYIGKVDYYGKRYGFSEHFGPENLQEGGVTLDAIHFA